MCQKCFKKGCHINAHHIEGYSENKELRINVENGITLCRICHKKFHNIYGRGRNTTEQYNEFIQDREIINV